MNVSDMLREAEETQFAQLLRLVRHGAIHSLQRVGDAAWVLVLRSGDSTVVFSGALPIVLNAFDSWADRNHT